MLFDLLIRGADVVTGAGRPQPLDIGVKDGRIAALMSRGCDAAATETIEATRLVAFPGVLDVHLHLGHGNSIARPETPEDVVVETSAATAGGVTTIVPYLMSAEPYEAIFDDVLETTEAGALVDFGYHFIISTESQLKGVPQYTREFGVPTFKIFMNNRGGEGERLGLPDIDDGYLYRLCQAAADHGGMVCPHPENIEVAWVLREKLISEDPEGTGSLRTWNKSRPPLVEAEAIARAARLARAAGARLYVVHTSSAEALAAAESARADGTDIIIETCPHYLTHTVEWAGGDIAKINPPIREQADLDALWDGIARGVIDTIATDHVHRGLAGKQGGIWKASPGCPGLETLLPVMLSEGHVKRGLSLDRIAELLAGNPARSMGLSDRKGRISVGLDADFALVDLSNTTVVNRESIRSSAGYSIYEGQALSGAVERTIVRGRTVFAHGQTIHAAAGHGRFLHRSLT